MAQGEAARLFCGCVDEERYAEQMEGIVEPYLREHALCGKTEGLYFEFYGQDAPRGTVAICYGFTESCEKYHELIYYIHRAGYQAAVIDHRGHGKSVRDVADLQLVHVDDFSLYVDDFHTFITAQVMPRAQGKPLYLYSHSMGGCIGALYLGKYRGIFEKAVLCAPMFGIDNGGIPDFVAELVCRTAVLFGKKRERMFTADGFAPEEPFEKSCCDSRARHSYYLKICREHEEYQTCCPSYGWALQALKAQRKAIAPENAARIKIPVLLCQAAHDATVRAKEQELFLRRVPDGRKIVKESKHEIGRMPGEKLAAYLEEVLGFFGEDSRQDSL